ncbi:MAG: HDOD domain-containing protein [Limisphaerales bacterium]
MPTLDTYLQQIRTLPPAPRVLVELLPLLRANDTDAAKIVELIAYDPAMTTKLLCRCNSVALGLAEPVETVEDAITHLGFNEVYRLVAMLVSQSTLGTAQKGYGMVAGDLWRHSAVTAFASRFVAQSFGSDENTAFTAGLLHDIGKILLNWALLDAYPGIAEKIRDMGYSFSAAEKEVLGLDHAELGGRILSHWCFPENLVRAVWHHHDPLRAHPCERLAGYVHLGDIIAHALGIGDGINSHAVTPCPEVLNMLEITPKDLEILILETGTALKAAGWILEE